MTKATKTTWRMRLLGLIVLVIAMLCTTTFSAIAAEAHSISLRAVSNGDLTLPTIESRSSRYEVTDVTWSETENLEAGDKVTGTVTVEPTEGNAIYIDGKSDINISGSGAEVTSYSRSGYTFKIKIRYTIKGDLSTPEEAYWDEDSPWVARWSRVSNAQKYQVQLYADGHREYSKETRSTSYNFAEELAERGIYEEDDVYFRVRAISSSNDESDWLESDTLDDDDWYEVWYYCTRHNIDINHRKDDDDDDDNDWNGPAYVTPDGWWRETANGYYFYINGTKQYGWISRPSGWYYCNPSSGRMETGWQYINGCWYYLKEDGDDCGRMLTGWVQAPGGWYYLDTSGAMVINAWKQINGYWYYFGNDGYMVTGWRYINNNWYYFNSSGAAVKGWMLLDGYWYYFCNTPKNGFPECAMAYNCVIDGYYVDYSGRRVR